MVLMDELHELHSNDYPMALEKLEITQNVLSNYCSSISNKYEIKIGVNKLVPNLGNYCEYVIHCRNIQLYLSLGIIHRIIKI